MARKRASVKPSGFTILVVDDKEEVLSSIRPLLEREGHIVLTAGDGPEAINIFKENQIHLMLLDYFMPKMTGESVVEEIRRFDQEAQIVLQTGYAGEKPPREMLKRLAIQGYHDKVEGAEKLLLWVDVSLKAYAQTQELRDINSKLKEKNAQLDDVLNVILSLASAVEAKDTYTRGHSDRVADYSLKIATELGFSQEEQRNLYFSGLIHDIGKIGIPDSVLTKPGPLTVEEYDTLKTHTAQGVKICEMLKSLSLSLPIILSHHERWDGRGYPEGLKGEETPLEARIVAVADGYDAMTSDRAYRDKMPITKVVEILKDGGGTQWDGEIIKIFLKVMDFD